MTPTLATRFWIPALATLLERLLGITFDLAGLTFDEDDLDFNLGHGRE